jgi:hypothetical protein
MRGPQPRPFFICSKRAHRVKSQAVPLDRWLAERDDAFVVASTT